MLRNPAVPTFPACSCTKIVFGYSTLRMRYWPKKHQQSQLFTLPTRLGRRPPSQGSTRRARSSWGIWRCCSASAASRWEPRSHLTLPFAFHFPMEISTVGLFSRGNKQTPCQIWSPGALVEVKTADLPLPPHSPWQRRSAAPRRKAWWGAGLRYLYCSCLSHCADTVQSSGSSLQATLQAKQTPPAKVAKIFLG